MKKSAFASRSQEMHKSQVVLRGLLRAKDNSKASGQMKNVRKSQAQQWEEQIMLIMKKKAKQDISTKPKRQQLFYIYKRIMNRRNFEYSLRHILNYFISCRQCKKNESLREGASKRDLYLNRAIVKLKNDMSVTKLLSRAQVMQEMHQILFNPSDRMLMKLQKRGVVSSNTESAEE